MAKTNSLLELNNRLFEQLNAITNPDLEGDKLKQEIERTDAVISISRVIIDNANLCLRAQIVQDNKLDSESKLPEMLLE